MEAKDPFASSPLGSVKTMKHRGESFSPNLSASSALFLLAFMLLAWPVTAETGQLSRGDPEEAERLTALALEKLEAGELVAAIDELDLAIEADADYWEAWYQRGRALGLLQQYPESRDALLQAAELNPGHGHTHRLAALAASRAEDYETAWDQAIRASLAGEDMNQLFVAASLSAPDLPGDPNQGREGVCGIIPD